MYIIVRDERCVTKFRSVYDVVSETSNREHPSLKLTQINMHIHDSKSNWTSGPNIWPQLFLILPKKLQNSFCKVHIYLTSGITNFIWNCKRVNIRKSSWLTTNQPWEIALFPPSASIHQRNTFTLFLLPVWHNGIPNWLGVFL